MHIHQERLQRLPLHLHEPLQPTASGQQRCGDRVTIDWGYLYLTSSEAASKLSYDEEGGKLGWGMDISGAPEKPASC